MKLNMAQRVANVFARHKNVYAGIVPVEAAAGELNECIDQIRQAEVEQGTIIVTAASKEKDNAEKKMVDLSVRMANILYLIGFESDNAELTALSNISPRTFYRVSDNEKLAWALRICGQAILHAAALAPYGLDEKAIGELQAATDAFRAVISKPMDTIGSLKQKTLELEKLFAFLDSIFYDKLDKLMILFKYTAPSFYDEYRTARNLINTAQRHKSSQ
jgi:hypothetical protein